MGLQGEITDQAMFHDSQIERLCDTPSKYRTFNRCEIVRVLIYSWVLYNIDIITTSYVCTLHP